MIRMLKCGVKRLIDGEMVDCVGVSEFFEALQHGNEEVAMGIFKNGANIFRVTKNGSDSLIYAAKGNNNNLIRLLLEKGVKPGAKNSKQQTAVIICCENGNLEGMQLLLKHGATLAETTHEGEGYLISRAIWGKNPDLVDFLIKNGVSTEHLSQENFSTPLTLTVYWGNVKLARALLEGGANPNAMGKNGDCPLLAAHKRNNPTMIDMLLKHGADPQRLRGPCHICNKTFFSGSYQVAQGERGNAYWHCLWCGRPTCSACAGGIFGRSSDREHRICKPCMAASGLLQEKAEHALNTIWRWSHRRENIGKSNKTFQCPICKKAFDLATVVNTFSQCIFHDHICPSCMPDANKCPICELKKKP